MRRESVKEKLIGVLCREYQSVWLIDVNDLSMEIFAADESKSINQSIAIASVMNSYEKARHWYIENNVMEHNRDRLKQQTSVEYILEMTSKGDPYYVEYSRVKDGEVNYNQLCYDRIANMEGRVEYITLGFRDIDYRKKSEIDDLTGLLTRRAFCEKAEEELHNNPDVQYDIVFSDIVDFKKINETYGIKTADAILRWNGKYISQMKREGLLVGRYGGDQFVIFGNHDSVKNMNSEIGGDAYFRAEKENGLPDIVVKYGIYRNIRHDRSIISSCDKAQLALGSIKEHYEKNIAFYDERFKEKLDKQRRIENVMHTSMENGDFKVYYQPKHDARTGKLVGAEALVRWIHPEYGFMSPADFIPLFEKNGFIVENDRFVWRRTCENIRRWKSRGVNTVPISVNASKLTMSNDDIVTAMQMPVKENGISPNELHIEITETLMAEDVDALVDKLNHIRAAGFEIELDDFGAGYSSMNILSTLPLDVVKLDMSFMQQFGNDKKAKVLAACVNLAKDMGFKTVSEGVELEEQNKVLGELGVDMIQGYLYSKPLPEAEFERYMLSYQ